MSTLKITAEVTPNPDAFCFRISETILPSGTKNYSSAAEAADSLLAKRLFAIDSVTGILLGTDFVTVTKAPLASWQAIVPEVKQVLEAMASSLRSSAEPAADTKTPEGRDGEITKRILEILDREIRPAVARDGGDIVFSSYKDGIVSLHMEGACRHCPSSIMTLKFGVENRLKQEIPEIIEVVQV